MADASIDLIRLEGHGNSVILRVTGARHGVEGPVLTGEFLVETSFVRGTLPVQVSPADLWEWRNALDALDAGHDIAWCEETSGASLFIDRAGQQQALVTIKDEEASVTVTVPMPDMWFDDAYARLDRTWQTWPVSHG